MVNTTAIISLRLDSPQREKNINIVLSYLLKHTNFNIIVTECDVNSKLDIKKFESNRVKYIFEKIKHGIFHRTRLLNQMLDMVDTPVVVNHDADVFLLPESYSTFEKIILTKQADLLYPFRYDGIDQRRIFSDTPGFDKFETSLDVNDLKLDQRSPWLTRHGHMQFFNTESYIKGFMENENYKHWCPEDHERGVRFQKLGYKVVWVPNLVFHLEHPSSDQPKPQNLDKIELLHTYLISETSENIKKYYEGQEYLQKYNSYKKICTV